eukprot:g1648.t1
MERVGTMMMMMMMMMMMIPHVHGATSRIGCLDNDGNLVDWFFTYKLPGGYQFAYADSNTGSVRTQMLQVYERQLDDKDKPVALIQTLRSLLPSISNRSDRTYFMYNDQPDNAKPSPSYAHAKGVVAMDGDGSDAVWILHSTPHFPAPSGSGKFYFPEAEITYGQTFLCMTLRDNAVDSISSQLRVIAPYVYFSNVASSAKKANPNVAAVLSKNFTKDEETSNTKTFKVGSHTFKSFAKSKRWDSDLYEDLIAPSLKSGLLVETWMRGSELGPYCPSKYDYAVTDVSNLQAFGPDGSSKVTWSEGGDHSKWAVEIKGTSQVCVGDTNRMSTQRTRGGGAVCFAHSGLWHLLNNSVVGADAC